MTLPSTTTPIILLHKITSLAWPSTADSDAKKLQCKCILLGNVKALPVLNLSISILLNVILLDPTNSYPFTLDKCDCTVLILVR